MPKPDGWDDWPYEKRANYVKALRVKRDKVQRDFPHLFYKPLRGIEPFHRSLARNRLITGGNRAGKTEGGTMEDIYFLLGESPFREIPQGPLTGIIAAPSLGTFEQTIYEKLKDLAPKDRVKIKFSKASGGGTVTGPNGIAHIKSYEAGWQSVQGMALDFAHLDEEGPYEFYKQIRKRLKRGRKLYLWMTMTAEPDRPDHWTYDELAVPARDPKRAADFAHFEADLEDNRISRGGYLDDEEIDFIISVTPVDERPAVIHGKYVQRGGRMYPMWNKDVHVAPDRSLKEFLSGVQDGTYTVFGALDWGVRNPTAILLVLEDKDSNCHVVDEIYRPARDVLDIKREFHKRFGVFRPLFVVADPSIWHSHDSQDASRTIAGQFEIDDCTERLPSIPLIKADNDVTNGLAAVRGLLRNDPKAGPRLRVQSRCINLIAEIESYVGDEWINKTDRNKKETPKKHNDHAVDALRYFAMSPHRWVVPPHQRRRVPVHANPVTGYVRAG
jgi:hypothetical protein